MKKEALEVITSTAIATLATLSEDGSPYATPITYKFIDGYFTWVSAPDATHSLNIERDGRISLSIIENVPGKARSVYVNTTASATGETTFNEQWQQTLASYKIELGKLDTKKSTPGRFYFKGVSA